jgi:hypothetical protein
MCRYEIRGHKSKKERQYFIQQSLVEVQHTEGYSHERAIERSKLKFKFQNNKSKVNIALTCLHICEIGISCTIL